MTAEIVPFGEYTLCQCGAGVAVIPIIGATVCEACFEAHRAKSVPAAEIYLDEPEASPPIRLDDILAKLVAP